MLESRFFEHTRHSGRVIMSNKKGWAVVSAGVGINLALGILYTWSIFKSVIAKYVEGGGLNGFSWDPSSINDPYAVCCIVFAFSMMIAGRIQDRFGPKVTAFSGGLLVGLGFLWISQSTAYMSWVLGFGGVVGMGIGFGYSSATPPALKWFPPKKTGMIAGIVVSGFGLASVYIAPLANYLLNAYGLRPAMMIFGAAFTVIVCGFSTLLVNPPDGYHGEKSMNAGGIRLEPSLVGWLPETAAAQRTAASKKPAAKNDIAPSELFKRLDFYLLWILYFAGAGAGLMVIGSVAGMAKKSLGEMAFIAVATMAVGNAAGRIAAGILSDRLGRRLTLFSIFVFQAVLMFAAVPIISTAGALPLVFLATFIGFNYGANLSLFPSFAKDLWGLRNFGTNYGALFTAWGMGGFVLSRVSQMLATSTGSYGSSFTTAGILLSVGAGATLAFQKTLTPKTVQTAQVEMEKQKKAS